MTKESSMTPDPTLFAQVLDPKHRANPYPLYARLRETPVSRQDDGTYVVSTYAEIAALLHDPRMSSDPRKRTAPPKLFFASRENPNPSFVVLDPPEHDRLRRQVMRHFTPARVQAVRPYVAELARQALDARRGAGRLDVVDELAYPLPVSVICRLLGVPREDEPRFHPWVERLVRGVDPVDERSEEEQRDVEAAFNELRRYMDDRVAERRARPTADLLSGLANDPDGMAEPDLISTLVLLLIAGHETTVNLIDNGMLTLLRYPDALARLRREPELAIPLVEEVLRYEPPVHFVGRTPLADVEVAGATLPKGAFVVLALAGGNRDPRRFADPDRFVPDRADNAHLGFGGGAHLCVGAPLARMEAQIVLAELARRLVNPRLLADPPPYRAPALLRGPRHLPIAFDRLAD
jgi:cytochrome P450